MTCEEHDWIDANGLVAWLGELGYLENVKPRWGSGLEGALKRWRKPGAKADVYRVDFFLTKMGLHLHEIPEHLWTDNPAKEGALTPTKRREAMERLEAGEGIVQVARDLGVCHSTLRHHRAKARKAESAA